MSWAFSNASMLAHLLGQNAYLALVPVLVGLVISLPLGIAQRPLGLALPARAQRHQRAVRACPHWRCSSC